MRSTVSSTAVPSLISFSLQVLVAALSCSPFVDYQHPNLGCAWHNNGCCQVLEMLERAAQALESMVAACLRKDADKRPSATQLLKDPVLKHGHDHKWLAKRLSGLDKSSRRASSVGDDSTAHSPASSSSHSTSSVSALLCPQNQSHPGMSSTRRPNVLLQSTCTILVGSLLRVLWQCTQVHTRHSLFSRHSSKTLPVTGSSQQHVDKGKTVHHLAWAFDLEGRPYVLVFELTQW